MKRSRNSTPPWKKPGSLVWLAVSLGLSLWMVLSMPAGSPAGRGMGMRRSAEPVAAASARSGEHSSAGTPKKEHRKKRGEASPAGNAKKAQPAGAWERLADKADTFGSLFCMVGIAAFIGSVMESRHWHLIFARAMSWLTGLARMPRIVGLSMPTALFSNAAANGMLVSSHSEGRLSRSALIAGGMTNSYLSYLSHSIRVLYPVVGAVGIPGALYFAGQFGTGLLFVLGVLCWHRWKILSGRERALPEEAGAEEPPELREPLAWVPTARKAAGRVGRLLFRMLCVTVPLMLAIEWLMKTNIFAFWEKYVPEHVNRFFPVELMSVVAAQMGGLVNASLVAANLRSEGLIDSPQILLALLVGSAIGNPFRTLRRNLPSALGIFQAREAFTIVIGMQISRFVMTLLYISVVVLVMHYIIHDL